MIDIELEKLKPRRSAFSGDHLADIAFSELYGAWRPKVRRWVGSLGPPPGEADDVVQEVFIIVRRKFSTFRSGNFAGWLYRITARTVRDFRQKAWFRRRVPEGLGGRVTHDAESKDPATLFELAEGQRDLDLLISQMSPKRREALVLFALEGYSGEEIAARNQIPLATVWTRLYHARKDLGRIVERAGRGGADGR